MLNGSALNRVAPNAVAGVLLCLATATFTAEATVTSSANIHYAASADIQCSAHAVFGTDQQHFGRWSGSVSPRFAAYANRTLAGSVAWTADSSFTLYHLARVQGAADFTATASIVFDAQAQPGIGGWVAGVQLSAEPLLTQAISGDWLARAPALNAVPNGIDRGATANWSGGADLWIEPTIRLSGESFDRHEAYFKPDLTADLNIDDSLTVLLVHGFEFAASVNAEFIPLLTHGAVGDWNLNGQWSATPTLVHPGQIDFTVSPTLSIESNLFNGGIFSIVEAGADFIGLPTVIHGGTTQWVTSHSLDAEATALFYAQTAWNAGGDLLAEATHVLPGVASWSFNSTLTMHSTVTKEARADWAANLGVFAGSAVFQNLPAPPSRTFDAVFPRQSFNIFGWTQSFEVHI